MARKVINRRQLREEMEAAEEAGLLDDSEENEEEESEEESDDEGKPKKKAAKAPKRKSKAKEAAEVRLKLFWEVCNNTGKRVALYEFSQKKHADQKATELMASGKQAHFVRKIKEPVKEN